MLRLCLGCLSALSLVLLVDDFLRRMREIQVLGFSDILDESDYMQKLVCPRHVNVTPYIAVIWYDLSHIMLLPKLAFCSPLGDITNHLSKTVVFFNKNMSIFHFILI